MEADVTYFPALTSTFIWALCGIASCLFLISLFWLDFVTAVQTCSGLFFKMYQTVIPRRKNKSAEEYWYPARCVISTLWKAWGDHYHGYEVINLDRIPKKGGALLVFYHGVVEFDWIFLVAKLFKEENLNIWTVADRIFDSFPAKDALQEGLRLCTGSMEDCLKILKEGKILGIAPGGSREALFSEPYSLMWNRRTGFARLALKAQVPIIPLFTRNIREVFFVPKLAKSYFRPFYERTRFPYTITFGGIPAKLTTFIGEPVPYDSETTPEELAEKVANSLRALIEKHQPLPRSYARAMWERWLHLVGKRTKLE